MLYAGRPTRVWSGATPYGEVSVWRSPEKDPASFVTRELVSTPDAALPDYRLATSVPDHWYPLKPIEPKSGPNAAPGQADAYRLRLALLLDADAMDDPLTKLPTPAGRLLSQPSGFEVHEEEQPRSGREVERFYQLARWTDGSTWLWSSRDVSAGKGEAASRLRFDLLEQPDADTAGDKQQ